MSIKVTVGNHYTTITHGAETVDIPTNDALLALLRLVRDEGDGPALFVEDDRSDANGELTYAV